MRYIAMSLFMSVLPAIIGVALAWTGHHLIAAVFFIAAGFGFAADLVVALKAYRAWKAGTR